MVRNYYYFLSITTIQDYAWLWWHWIQGYSNIFCMILWAWSCGTLLYCVHFAWSLACQIQHMQSDWVLDCVVNFRALSCYWSYWSPVAAWDRVRSVPVPTDQASPIGRDQFTFFYVRRIVPHPIGSMYGIYTNIGGILMVNVTIYSIHGSYGHER